MDLGRRGLWRLGMGRVGFWNSGGVREFVIHGEFIYT